MALQRSYGSGHFAPIWLDAQNWRTQAFSEVASRQVLASYAVNKPGVNVGAGLALGTKWHGKIYAEARYNRIFMGAERHTDYISRSHLAFVGSVV